MDQSMFTNVTQMILKKVNIIGENQGIYFNADFRAESLNEAGSLVVLKIALWSTEKTVQSCEATKQKRQNPSCKQTLFPSSV